MSEIHQVLVTAATGDAVFHAALQIRELLRRITTSEIYVRNRAPELASEVRTLPTYGDSASSRAGANLLIYHVTIGEPEVTSFLLERPEPLVLVYHNISPAEVFDPYDRVFADRLRRGREELAALRDRAVMALADSPFNARELESMGFPNVRVSPLIIDLDRLHRVAPAAAASQRFGPPDTPAVLFVGQMLPHKRPDLLLQAFHVLSSFLVPEASLVLVGAQRLAGYAAVLKAFAAELVLRRVWFTGSVSLDWLAACYRRADVFVTMSEHEGFCVPLLEAMSFDVPVIARACAAIPETLDGAGLLLPPEPDPALAAEAIAAVLEDGRLREDLVDGGRKRVAAIDPDGARAAFLRNISDLL